MRYHIIKSGAPVSRLLYEQNTDNENWNFAFGGEPHEYYETLLPHTLMKIWQPLYQPTINKFNIWINRWRQNNTLTDEVGTFGSAATHQILNTGSLVVRNQSDIYALNGYIHTIDRPMLYNADVVHGVLNERMRMDAGSILHELSNNDIRFATMEEIANMNVLSEDGNMTRIPQNYFENLVAYSDFEMAWYTQGAWRAWNSDQLVTWYPVDMGIRLPSVPSGTYEIRIIYPPMASNGTIRSFIGTSTDTLSMQPLASFDATRPNTSVADDRQSSGYLLASEFDDYGVASDSVLRSNAYMRTPASFSRGTYNVVKERISSPTELLQNISASCRYEEGYGTTMLRKILGTVKIDQQNNYWLRISQVVTPEQFKAMGSRLENVAFSFDFIELVPISVVDSPDFEEDWY